MKRERGERRSGFALLPVVLALALLGAVAYLMAREGAMGVSQVSSTQRTDAARYVAEAALRHAEWRVQAANCSGYNDVPSTSFGGHAYSATITPSSGSPVAIGATGTLADGTPHTIERTRVAAYATPTTLPLQPDAVEGKDTFVYEWKNDWNYGASGHMDAGDNGPGSVWRTLLRFDLDSVPASSKVIAATLDLYQTTPSYNGGPLGVRRVTRDWDEGSNSGSSGSGATWWDRTVASLWNTPGGDLDPTPFASTNVPSATGWNQWEITDLVAGWVAGNYENDGLALVHDQAWAQGRFASSDHADPSLHPKLTVVYACECGGGLGDSQMFQPGPSAGADTYLDDGNPATSWSTVAAIRISNKINSQKRGLLHFDLSGINPAATVTSAVLELNLEGIGSGAAATIYAHRVLQTWIEAQATWNDATSVAPWATPGGAYDPTEVASANIDPLIPGPTTWSITPLAVDWVANPATNNGLVLLGSAEVNHADFTTSDSATAGLRPKLTVTYACPCGVDCSSPEPQIYRDEFNSHVCDTAVDYSQSDGTLDWTGFTWEDIGESSDSCLAGVRLRDDGAGPFIRVSSPGKGIKRQVDLSTFPSATLSFDYQRTNTWADATDRLSVRVSDDGGSGWTEIGAITGPGTDATVQTAIFDISAYRSATSVVQFLLENTEDASDLMNLDNVQIDDFTAPPAAASTLTLDAVADTRIEKGAPDDNFGADTQLGVGAPGGGGPSKPLHTLLRFDVSGVPAGATVTSATLRLEVEAVEGSGSIPVGAYRITAPWDEGSGTTALPTADGASWNNTGGGGSYDPTQLDQVSVPLAPGVVEWQLPPNLIHEWIDGVPAPGTNYGVILVYEAGQKGSRALPASRDHATSTLRPQLVLEYIAP